MVKLMSKLKTKEVETTTWETQSGKLKISKKVKVDFGLLEISATKIVTWKCHVDESTNGRYNMILVRYLLIVLGIYLKFSENFIHGVEGPYKGCLVPMVDVNN